jgi:hypothetical protein
LRFSQSTLQKRSSEAKVPQERVEIAAFFNGLSRPYSATDRIWARLSSPARSGRLLFGARHLLNQLARAFWRLSISLEGQPRDLSPGDHGVVVHAQRIEASGVRNK